MYPTDAEPFELARLDRATGERLAMVAMTDAACDDDKRIAIGFDAAWVVSVGGVVHRVDIASAKVLARIELTGHLEAIAVSAESVWVTSDVSGGRLFRIDPRTNTASNVASPAYPRELAAVDGGLWISHGGRVTMLDTRTMRTSKTHDLGGVVLALCAGGGFVWAATVDEAPIGARTGVKEGGLLFRVGSEGAVPVARIDGRALGLAFGFGGVWLAANRLERIDAATNEVTVVLDERVGSPVRVGDELWALRTSYGGHDAELVRIDPATGALGVVSEAPAAFAPE